jgi:hypothetical protein
MDQRLPSRFIIEISSSGLVLQHDNSYALCSSSLPNLGPNQLGWFRFLLRNWLLTNFCRGPHQEIHIKSRRKMGEQPVFDRMKSARASSWGARLRSRIAFRPTDVEQPLTEQSPLLSPRSSNVPLRLAQKGGIYPRKVLKSLSSACRILGFRQPLFCSDCHRTTRTITYG